MDFLSSKYDKEETRSESDVIVIQTLSRDNIFVICVPQLKVNKLFQDTVVQNNFWFDMRNIISDIIEGHCDLIDDTEDHVVDSIKYVHSQAHGWSGTYNNCVLTEMKKTCIFSDQLYENAQVLLKLQKYCDNQIKYGNKLLHYLNRYYPSTRTVWVIWD
jgi:hypothetical protein